jgi:Mrp family chromosome partitioning ATPase
LPRAQRDGAPSPAELLSAPRTADLIDALEARLLDVILFDLSPMLVADALAYLDQVDRRMVAALRKRQSPRSKCGKDLAMRTQVLGVVLNKCRYMEDSRAPTGLTAGPCQVCCSHLRLQSGSRVRPPSRNDKGPAGGPLI